MLSFARGAAYVGAWMLALLYHQLSGRAYADWPTGVARPSFIRSLMVPVNYLMLVACVALIVVPFFYFAPWWLALLASAGIFITCSVLEGFAFGFVLGSGISPARIYFSIGLVIAAAVFVLEWVVWRPVALHNGWLR